MKKINGEKGAICEWHEKPCDAGQIQEMSRKLTRLLDWANHFKLTTTLPAIITWINRGPHTKPLLVGPENQKVGFF